MRHLHKSSRAMVTWLGLVMILHVTSLCSGSPVPYLRAKDFAAEFLIPANDTKLHLIVRNREVRDIEGSGDDQIAIKSLHSKLFERMVEAPAGSEKGEEINEEMKEKIKETIEEIDETKGETDETLEDIDETKGDIDEVKESNKETIEEIDETKGETDEGKEENSETLEDIDETKGDIDEVNENNKKTIDKTKGDIDEVKETIEDIEEAKEESKEISEEIMEAKTAIEKTREGVKGTEGDINDAKEDAETFEGSGGGESDMPKTAALETSSIEDPFTKDEDYPGGLPGQEEVTESAKTELGDGNNQSNSLSSVDEFEEVTRDARNEEPGDVDEGSGDLEQIPTHEGEHLPPEGTETTLEGNTIEDYNEKESGEKKDIVDEGVPENEIETDQEETDPLGGKHDSTANATVTDELEIFGDHDEVAVTPDVKEPGEEQVPSTTSLSLPDISDEVATTGGVEGASSEDVSPSPEGVDHGVGVHDETTPSSSEDTILETTEPTEEVTEVLQEVTDIPVAVSETAEEVTQPTLEESTLDRVEEVTTSEVPPSTTETSSTSPDTSESPIPNIFALPPGLETSSELPSTTSDPTTSSLEPIASTTEGLEISSSEPAEVSSTETSSIVPAIVPPVHLEPDTAVSDDPVTTVEESTTQVPAVEITEATTWGTPGPLIIASADMEPPKGEEEMKEAGVSHPKRMGAYIIIGLIVLSFLSLLGYIALKKRIKTHRRGLEASTENKDTEKALLSLSEYKDHPEGEENNVKNNEITPIVIKQNSQINKFEKNTNFSSPKNLNTTANEKNVEKDNVLRSAHPDTLGQVIVEDGKGLKSSHPDTQPQNITEENKEPANDDKNAPNTEKLIVRTHMDTDSIPKKVILVNRKSGGYAPASEGPTS